LALRVSIWLITRVDELFSKWIFWRWIAYGIFQGIAAFYVSFIALNGTEWSGVIPSMVSVDGQLVFTGVVTLVNLKILFSTNNYTFFSFFLTIGSILFFILSFYVLNLVEASATMDIYSQF
jgi:Phospholipid-translocating P-type ATPase C-terminal